MRWVGSLSIKETKMERVYFKGVAAFIFALYVQIAHGFVDPPVILPVDPVAGQALSVSVRSGICDGFFSNEPAQVIRTGNSVRVVLEGVHEEDPLHCIMPDYTSVYPIGSFEAGSYTFQIDRHYVPFGGTSTTETLRTLQVVVAGTPNVPLPAIGPMAALAVVLALFFAAAFRLRRHHVSLIVMPFLALLPLFSNAQEPDRYIKVLVSIEPGAPTAYDLVHYLDFSPPAGPPPLEAFSAIPPAGVSYLLPLRASGDFLAYLEANPESVRARLERYVLVAYTAQTDYEAALQSLRSDPYVMAAYPSLEVEFSSASLIDFGIEDQAHLGSGLQGIPAQYGWDSLNIGAAWELAGGYAMIGSADSGLAVAHPALRQFSATGQYLGGNFIPASSLDLGDGPGFYDADVNEVTPMPLPVNSPCNPNGLPAVETSRAGHGSHVAGLQAANGASGLGVKGTCKHCGIAMWKIARNQCIGGLVLPRANSDVLEPALIHMTDTGSQVVNLSLGVQRSPQSPETEWCPTHLNDPWCLGLAHAEFRGAVIVASSGNHRDRLQFPAMESSVIAAGGFDSNHALWDDSPGSTTFCPNPPSSLECGSNYTKNLGEARQELMASAKSAFSTVYPGKDYSIVSECGDSFGTPMSDGLGLCTGTSMSAPQIAGVVGILRSINPLVIAGKPVLQFGDVVGIRTVLAQTTVEAQNGQPWTQTFGHGQPDAAAAAARMLGKVQERTVKNRATPLFRMYSANSKDHADTTSPQGTLALLINQESAYQPQGSFVPGYANFPTEPGTTPLAAPRASIYVLTTEYKPRPEWPALVPLYQMDRSRNYPIGCTPQTPGCNTANRDFILVTTTANIEQAYADGYKLRNIQGYIYQPCTVEPACIPPGAEKVYRACKVADDDCATFLESERTTFEAVGYTAAYPSGSNKVLGYAYPYADNDPPRFPGGPVGDGMVDGFERVIGTKIDSWDSDGDVIGDAEEFSMVGVAVSDPCSGTSGRNCPADVIFQNGFQ